MSASRSTWALSVALTLSSALPGCSDDSGGSATTGGQTEGQSESTAIAAASDGGSSGTTSSDADSSTSPTAESDSESSGDDSSGGVSTTGTDSGPVPVECGNGVVEAAEECDLGPDNGIGLGCRDDCITNTCPDGYVGPGEQCDDGNRIDEDDCPTTCQPPLCGDGFLHVGVEPCDDELLGGASCDSLGLGVGTLTCFSNCTFNDSGCEYCGNDTLDPAEACDGELFSPEHDSCVDEGFVAGTLSCDASCQVVTTECTTCGDNSLDPSEVCDGDDLDGETCSSQGFSGGTLQCATTCDAFDTNGCTA